MHVEDHIRRVAVLGIVSKSPRAPQHRANDCEVGAVTALHESEGILCVSNLSKTRFRETPAEHSFCFFSRRRIARPDCAPTRRFIGDNPHDGRRLRLHRRDDARRDGEAHRHSPRGEVPCRLRPRATPDKHARRQQYQRPGGRGGKHGQPHRPAHRRGRGAAPQARGRERPLVRPEDVDQDRLEERRR